MREPPKMIRPEAGDELVDALQVIYDNMEAAMDWVREAVETVEREVKQRED